MLVSSNGHSTFIPNEWLTKEMREERWMDLSHMRPVSYPSYLIFSSFLFTKTDRERNLQARSAVHLQVE